MPDQFYHRTRFGQMHKYRKHGTLRKPRLNFIYKVRPHVWRACLVGLPPPMMVLKHPEGQASHNANLSMDQIL